jgi:hypothetical protein
MATIFLIQATEPGTSNLPGQVILTLLVAAVLAFPVSLALLALYRRAVLRSMGDRADSWAFENEPPESTAPPGQPMQTVPAVSFDHESTAAQGGGAENLYSNLLHRPWRAAAVYAVAGSCYALIMVAAFLEYDLSNLVRSLFVFWIYAWPVVLTINVVAAATRRAKIATASVYFLVFVTLGAIGIARSPALDWGQIAYIWIIINFPVTVLLMAFLNRRIRAVGPLVMAFMVVAVMGSLVATQVPGIDYRLLRLITEIGLALGTDASGIYIGLHLLGFIVFGLVGWLALKWIRNRYERKKVSDQSITLDAIWLLFGVGQSIGPTSSGLGWLLLGPFAFIIYKIIAWVGFQLLGRRLAAIEKTPELLLLRVFSLGRRSERLFDALATHWRHVGSIRFIAGPDLATTTVEPHEFLDFLSGKLARRFIDTPRTLDLRVSEMDLRSDQDGRFRVNDFFCYEDTWRTVLSRLVRDSDVVLMDLRGFSPQNAGVVYEIEELINVVPLERVVFIVDSTTDEDFLSQTVQECWERMRTTSPNRSSTPGQLRLFRFIGSHGGELRQLLHVMCGAVKSTGPIEGSKAAPG